MTSVAVAYEHDEPKGRPVNTQPTTHGGANRGSTLQFMPPPQTIPGVPPGLEYLTQIDQLLIHQQIEIFEALTSWETCNRYQIKNSLGQQVYFAAEESDCCMRQCCGPARGFVMHITDNNGQEVIRVNRDFKCCAGCGWCATPNGCCSMEIRIEAPVGQTMGYLKQAKSYCGTKYVVENEEQKAIFTIPGPCCPCQGLCCRADIEFPVGERNLV